MPTQGNREILDLLARTLQVEYRIIVHYPALMAMLPDTETRNIALAVGLDSIRHADIIRETIIRMGEDPPFPDLDPLPDQPAVEIFKRQLELEKLALFLHTQAANLAPPECQESFRQIAEQEKVHVQGVERILERLQPQHHLTSSHCFS